MRPEPLDRLEARLQEDADRKQRLDISLRHNRLGNISPFQRERLQKKSRYALLWSVVAVVVEMVLMGIGILNAETVGTSYLIVLAVGMFMTVLFIAGWWNLSADLEGGTVKTITGPTRIQLNTRRTHAGESTTRRFYIGPQRLDDSMAEGLVKASGMQVRGYYTPRTRILLAVEPASDAPPPPGRQRPTPDV